MPDAITSTTAASARYTTRRRDFVGGAVGPTASNRNSVDAGGPPSGKRLTVLGLESGGGSLGGGATQAIEVGPEVGRVRVLALLRRHEVGRADHGAVHRERADVLMAAGFDRQRAGQTQVENLDDTGRLGSRHEQVGRLHVAVNQP